VIYAKHKLHFEPLLLFSKKHYYLKEIEYVDFRDNPENSESGVRQTKKEALKQLRYVERGLRWLEMPVALGKQAKKGLAPIALGQ
jgi:hypothetical protein